MWQNTITKTRYRNKEYFCVHSSKGIKITLNEEACKQAVGMTAYTESWAITSQEAEKELEVDEANNT